MKKICSLKFLGQAFLGLAFLSCGSMQKIAVNTSGGMLVKGSPSVEREANWDFFRSSVPANLMLMEGLHYIDKENQDLNFALTKGHAGYGMSVGETLNYERELSGGGDEELHKKNAISHFSKSLHFGLEYLKANGISQEELLSLQVNPEGLLKLLNSKLDNGRKDNGKHHLETVFYMGLGWAGLINLQKNRPSLLGQLPLVKTLFDWVCGHEPDFQYGSCGIFYGSYESSRPTMLGGNPEKGKEIFLAGIKKHPLNLLLRVSYIQYYLAPLADNEGYKEQKTILSEARLDFEKNHQWFPGEDAGKWEPALNLFNATALKRFEIISKNEKSIFE